MTELDEAVSDAQTQVDAQIAAMAQTKQEFLQAAEDWLRSALPDGITAVVVGREHDHTVEIGEEGTERLRAEIASEMDRLHDLVTDKVGQRRLWDHEDPDPKRSQFDLSYTTQYGTEKPRLPSQLQTALDAVVDVFIAVLHKSGYGRSDRSRLLWVPHDLPEPVLESLGKYDEQSKRLHWLLGKLNEATTARGRAEAEKLWGD